MPFSYCDCTVSHRRSNSHIRCILSSLILDVYDDIYCTVSATVDNNKQRSFFKKTKQNTSLSFYLVLETFVCAGLVDSCTVLGWTWSMHTPPGIGPIWRKNPPSNAFLAMHQASHGIVRSPLSAVALLLNFSSHSKNTVCLSETAIYCFITLHMHIKAVWFLHLEK